MTSTALTLLTDDAGQDLAEYAILLALIALVAIVAIRALGQVGLWNVFSGVSNELQST